MSENNITKIIRCVVEPWQDIENAIQQLLARHLDTATGVTLELFGKLVGQPRGNLTVDDDYRRVIRARIAANRSNGTVEDVLKVSRLVLNNDTMTLTLENHGNATQVLKIDEDLIDPTVFDLLMRLIHDTQAGGVRTIVEAPLSTPSLCFKWDTAGRGWDSGAPFRDARD